MKSFIRARSFSLLVLLLAFSAAATAAESGSIDKMSGNVTVTGADKQTRKAGPNEKIQSGETVVTQAKSEVVIKLADDSVIALRPNTQFKLDDYRYEKKPTDSARFSLLSGAARFLTGLIGKSSRDRFQVTAATATVGIRGTDFEVAIVAADTPEARAGVYDYVHDGETNIKLAAGPALDVKKEQTAFAPDKPKPGEAPLYILDSTPVFLQQGGGFDSLMQSLTMQPVNVIHQMPMFR